MSDQQVFVATGNMNIPATNVKLTWTLDNLDDFWVYNKSYSCGPLQAGGKNWSLFLKKINETGSGSRCPSDIQCILKFQNQDYDDRVRCMFNFTLQDSVGTTISNHYADFEWQRKYVKINAYYITVDDKGVEQSQHVIFVIPRHTILQHKRFYVKIEGQMKISPTTTITNEVANLNRGLEFTKTTTPSLTLSKYIAQHCNRDLYSDFTLHCQDRSFRCHKLILGQSHVFEKLFQSEMKEGMTNEVTISDSDPASLELFLKSLYGEHLIIPDDSRQILEILNCAEKYAVSGLKSDCLRKMTEILSDDNAGEFTVAAYTYFEEDKIKEFFRSYCQRRIKVLMTNPDFKHLYQRNLDAFI